VHELTASADQAEIIASIDGDLHYLAVDSQLADDARAFLDAAGTVLAYGPSGRVEAVVANDPLRVEQWPLDKVAFESVWPCSTGEGTTIAITDTGVDGTHPDFGSRVLHGASSFGGTLVEGNGDVDPSGHGTHVAGIAAAGTNDGIGVAGVAPDATILPFRMLDAQGKGSTLDLAAGIIWSTDEGADVINISVAASGSSSSMDYAISYALSRGVVIVAAAGNNGASGAPSYPAASEGVVAVGASTPTNGVAAFSNSGSYIDVVAPGTDVLSTIPGGWNTVSGTSMASPHVAGLAALLESGYGPLDYTQFRNSVVSTAVDLGPAGFDVRSGHGLVNPVAATHAL
jgi:subtilisin family serine protease